ncbi:MAG: FAD-binding protein, partial [Candidatus Kapaibacteriota bacterium]
MDEIRTEILVIGSGVAGLVAAFTVATKGREVFIIPTFP